MINIHEICDCCGGYGNQPILQIFDDRCFRVVDGKETHGEFCIKDFAFPVDGYQCFSLSVMLDGGELLLFDNSLETFSPSELLESEKLFARGVMVRIFYPTKNIDGDEVELVDKGVLLEMEDSATLIPVQYPIYDFFTIFTNPKSNKSSDLINKIKIVNPNLLYNVKVSALVIYGKAI